MILDEVHREAIHRQLYRSRNTDESPANVGILQKDKISKTLRKTLKILIQRMFKS